MEDTFDLPEGEWGTPIVLVAPAVNTTTQQTHNLRSTPIFFRAYWECITPEFGFVTGDRIHADSLISNTAGWGFVISADSSFMYVTTSNIGVLVGINKTTPALNILLTSANWKLVVFPYAVSSLQGVWI